MATGKEIRISIQSALNAAGIEATRQQVNAMSRDVRKSLGEMSADNKRHWADIKAAWDLGCAGIRTAWGAVRTALQSAFRFETQTVQFKTLIGSIDEARQHMADLKALGDAPPFSLDEFAKASRSLMVMTDGALGYKKSLEMIGDAAAATGHPIDEVSHAVGRLYAMIRDGQPVSRAVTQLRNMGIVSPEVAKKLQDLQEAGRSNAEIWAEVEAALGKYKGAMEETEKSGEGLLGAISSRWDNIVRAFGQAWQDSAKGGMQMLLDKMKEIEEDGTLAVWANKITTAIEEATEAAKTFRSSLDAIGKEPAIDMFDKSHSQGKNMDHSVGQFFGNAWAQLGAIGAGIRGAFMPSENAFDNYLAYGAIHGYGGFSDAAARKLNERKRASGEWLEDMDIRTVKAGVDLEIAQEAAEKAAAVKVEAEASASERAAKEEARVHTQLRESQQKQDEARDKAAAEKKAEEERKAAEKVAQERARLDAAEEVRRERMRQKELADRIRDHEKLLAAEQQAEGKARTGVAAAESKLQQAWGWYRNKDSMAAQLAEEKADAEARKQFEKDFDRLKTRRRDWRSAENLSVDDEAVRRVALAREEKQAAEKHLAEIEKNTADLAAKLDELLQVKG